MSGSNDGPSTAKIVWSCIGAFVLVIAIGIGAWAFRVATSDVKGKGDATIAQNEGANQNNQAQTFTDLYEGIQGTDDTIQDLAEQAAADGPSSIAASNLRGTKAICRKQVAQYNSMVTAPLSAKWLPEGLPTRIGDPDTATDCEPDNPPSANPAPAASSR